MGVRKFRSVEQMPGPPPRPPRDPENFALAFGLMDLVGRLHVVRRTPGVRKFASYEEMRRRRSPRRG